MTYYFSHCSMNSLISRTFGKQTLYIFYVK